MLPDNAECPVERPLFESLPLRTNTQGNSTLLADRSEGAVDFQGIGITTGHARNHKGGFECFSQERRGSRHLGEVQFWQGIMNKLNGFQTRRFGAKTNILTNNNVNMLLLA
jgi:hypothetical protein